MVRRTAFWKTGRKSKCEGLEHLYSTRIVRIASKSTNISTKRRMLAGVSQRCTLP